MCYSSTTVGELSACMVCRRGGRRLEHRFSVCLIFIFLRGL